MSTDLPSTAFGSAGATRASAGGVGVGTSLSVAGCDGGVAGVGETAAEAGAGGALRGDDDLAALGVERVQFHVGLRSRAFDDAEGADQFRRHAIAADAEILKGALGLCARLAVVGNLDGAEAVSFCACFAHARL